MSSSLSASDLAALADASSQGTARYLRRVETHFGGGRWLGPRNVYRQDPVAQIRSEFEGTRRRWPLQLGDYVAASSPLHLWDGWSYLGSAVDAHVRGSNDIARHLAYYAELRAAMSLLATQGIGIFNARHCVIDSAGDVTFLERRPTHEATWDYLEQWASGGAASALLSRVVRPRSTPVGEWLAELPSQVAWNPIGTELLLGMGLDLRRMADDRTARNQASYRPTGLGDLGPDDARHDADFAVEMIRLLEPGGVEGAFDILDVYLLRRAIELAFEAGTDTRPSEDIAGFRTAVSFVVAANTEPGPGATALENFLARRAQSADPAAVREALNTATHHEPGYHLQVLGRAMLLLRVATGAVRELMGSSNVELDDLQFWWREAGTRQGLWTDPPDVIDSSELWLDIDGALIDIDDWIAQGHESRQNLLEVCGSPIAQATGLARVALMGLAS